MITINGNNFRSAIETVKSNSIDKFLYILFNKDIYLNHLTKYFFVTVNLVLPFPLLRIIFDQFFNKSVHIYLITYNIK